MAINSFSPDETISYENIGASDTLPQTKVNGSSVMSSNEDAEAMPQARPNASSIMIEDEGSTISVIKHRGPGLDQNGGRENVEEEDVLSLLKIRSIRMPESHAQAQVNGSSVTDEVDAGEAMPQARLDASSLMIDDQESPISVVEHQNTTLAYNDVGEKEKDEDALSPLKNRSTSMPERRVPQLDRRTITMGMPMPHASALTIVQRPAVLASGKALVSKKTELSRAVSQARRKLGEIFDSEVMASIAEMKKSRLQRYIANTRMRLMPHQNSRVDRYLKKAEFFAKCVANLVGAVNLSDGQSDEAARLIWRCVEIILSGQSHAAILERIFSALDEATEIIQYLCRDQGMDSSVSGVSDILVKALATVLDLCVELTTCFKASNNLTKLFFFEFEHRFRGYMNTLYECKAQFLGVLGGTSFPPLGFDVLKIRRWLSGYDRTVFDDYSRLLGGRVARYEITCDWVTPMMRDFMRSSEDLLFLNGPPGCGKSFAMNDIVDFARTNMRQRSFKLLAFSIDYFAPLRQSATHLVKNLLLQLLDLSVGDHELFEALCGAYRRIEVKHESSGEEILWTVLTEAIRRQKDETLIVIDGLDKIEGGSAVSIRITIHLQALMASRRNLRCIILSRPFDKVELPSGFPRPFFIPDVHDADIRRFIQAYIVKAFVAFTAQQRRELFTRILERNIHSYVEVQLLFSILARERAYDKVCILLKQIPRTLSGLVILICQSLDRQDPQVTSIFSVLLVAQRPLQLDELKRFSGMKTEIDTHLEPGEYSEIIRQRTGGLVDVSGSQAHFLSSEVRQHIIELCKEGRFIIDLASASVQMTVRCLSFIRDALKDTNQRPIFQETLGDDTASLFRAKIASQSHLEYALRYYLVHYLGSGRQDSGSVLLPANLKAAFSDSVLFAIIERRWWERQFGTIECERMLVKSLELRRAAFGSQAKCVLQNMLELAFIRRKLGRYSVSMKVLYEAWSVSTKLYGEHDSICIAIAEAFVTLSQFVSDFETEFTSEVERLYLYLYHAKKRMTATADRGALYYGDLLVDFFVRLHRIKQACSLRRELYEMLVEVHGALHDTTRRYTQLYIELLESLGDYSEIGAVRGVIYAAAADKLPPWDPLRIRITIELVESCEARRAYKEAENALRLLWQALLLACSGRIDDAVDCGFTDITLRLSNFFQLRGKLGESKRVLLELWKTVYSGSLRQRTCPSDTVLVNLRKIGDTLISLKEHRVATELLSLLRNWYIGTGRKTYHEAILISISLSQCYQYTDRSADAEDILEFLFDILIAAETVDRSMADICIQLATVYGRALRWQDAIQICKRALSRFWSRLLVAGGNECGLPSEYDEEAIQLALCLANLYYQAGSIAEAEHIRVLIFRSCRSSWSIEDVRLIQTAQKLCDFYEQQGKIDKALEIWRDLQKRALSLLGRQSKIYIQISYCIARLAKRHGRHDVDDVLRDIILAYGDGHDACGHGSIEAVLELIRLYEQQKRSEELRRWYYNLFMAFRSKGHDCGLKGEDFFMYFTRYIELLIKDKDVLAIDIARKFRATCISMYGPRATLSIRALFQLATVLEMHSSHMEEAIRIYEEICGYRNYTESKIILDLVRSARARLAVLYCSGKGSPQKAEQIFIVIWEEAANLHGYASEQALNHLRQLVQFYSQRSSIDVAFSTLETAIIKILLQERDNSRLFAAAKQLYSMFQLIGSSKIRALDLLASLRIDFNSAKRGGRMVSVDRQSFILILALEELLNGNTKPTLYTDVLQDLMMETILYEKWIRSCTYGDLSSRLSVGAQLLSFLERKHRKTEVEQITQELWVFFASDFNVTTEKSGVLYELFVVCIGDMKQDKTFKLFETAVSAAIGHAENARFQECYDLSSFVHTYVGKRGGWATEGRSVIGFKLATTLIRHRTANSLHRKMEELSLKILSEVLKSKAGISFDGLSRYQLHLICVLLGQLGAWDDLQTLLERLWNTRTKTKWDYTITIQIGLRLCEARFHTNQVDEALSLLRDIRYNTAEAFGPLHPLTIKCDSLRAKLYTSVGKHALAADTHVSLLRQIRSAQEDGLEEYIYVSDYDDLDLSALSYEHSRQLKLNVQHHGRKCWHDDDNEQSEVEGLLRDLKGQFSSGNNYWDDIDPSSLASWADHEASLPKTGEFGCWEPPSEWGFLTSFESEEDAALTLPNELDGDDVLGGIATGGFVCGFDRDDGRRGHFNDVDFGFDDGFNPSDTGAFGPKDEADVYEREDATLLQRTMIATNVDGDRGELKLGKDTEDMFDGSTFTMRAGATAENAKPDNTHEEAESSFNKSFNPDSTLGENFGHENGVDSVFLEPELNESLISESMPQQQQRYTEHPSNMASVDVDITEVPAFSDDGDGMPTRMPQMQAVNEEERQE